MHLGGPQRGPGGSGTAGAVGRDEARPSNAVRSVVARRTQERIRFLSFPRERLRRLFTRFSGKCFAQDLAVVDSGNFQRNLPKRYRYILLIGVTVYSQDRSLLVSLIHIYVYIHTHTHSRNMNIYDAFPILDGKRSGIPEFLFSYDIREE